MIYSKYLFLLIILLVIILPRSTWAMPDEGMLIKGLSNKVYVIENGLKRWIKTADIFNKLGYSWTNIKRVSEKFLDSLAPGKDINRSYQYPDGTLLRGSGAPVYLIEKGLKRWIPNPQIFTAMGFKWQNIIQISDKILNRIKKDHDISLAYNASNHRPQTIIVDGPCKQHQTTIPKIKTNQVEFGYSGYNSQRSTTGLSFETFLDGYDKKWTTSRRSYKRKFTLLPGNITYTFYVRAKDQNKYYDLTPASCKFTVNLSPYYQQIRIFFNRQIVLKTSRSSKNINITGWTVTTKTSKIATIPQALEIVHPETMYNYEKDLILEPNEKISIYNGASPIDIDAYKVNSCLKYYDDEAEYRNCFYENNQYPDFLKKEWRIYLNRSSEFLIRRNQEIILKDRDGLVVDRYNY